ncbi:MAG: YCF48-related protein [Proteobacteria bacterium]|nr:YCF48-related protein [Pseudomonadota bacterium]
MGKKIRAEILFLLALIVLAPCCSKFDRSKIKMPKFSFVTSENVHSIAYVDVQHIWISGNYGTICFSSDGGKTWVKQESGLKDVLLGSIRFVNQREGWAAGVGGTIIHTTDGGKTWNPQKSGTDKALLDLFFLDSRNGWAVGELGTVIHTDNGGTTWSVQHKPEDKIYNNVFFTDNSTGWIVGEFGTILRTEDGGATWQPQECKDLAPETGEADWEKPRPALYGIYFENKELGWIAGMDGVILKTADAGKTWSKVVSGTDKPLYSLIVRGSKGWAIGNKGVYLISSDGGTTWQVKEDAIKTKFWLRKVAFCDGLHGLVVGARGTIVQSDDGGANWNIVSGFTYDTAEFGLADF